MRKNLLISKIISVILAAMLAFAYTAAIVYADAPSESGTPEEPYIVKTAEELLALGEMEEVGYVRLDADIDMSGVTGKSCIIQKLTGEFDGNGHTISNLELEGKANASIGFISELKGNVLEVNFESISIEDGISNGSIVGIIAGSIPEGSNVLIEKCAVNGKITNKTSGSIYIGGLIGRAGMTNSDTDLKITSCISDVTIACVSNNYAGGILGFAQYKATVDISKCSILGNIKGSGANSCGIVGYYQTTMKLKISDVCLESKIDGKNNYGIAYNSFGVPAEFVCDGFYYDNDLNKPTYSSFLLFKKTTGLDLSKCYAKKTDELKSLELDGFAIIYGKYNGYPVPVWTAAPEPEPDYPFSVKLDADNNVLVSVPVEGNYYIIFTAYDDENGLISLSAEKKDFKVGENQKVTPSDEFNPAGAAKIRAMLWNSPVDLCPLTEAAEK